MIPSDQLENAFFPEKDLQIETTTVAEGVDVFVQRAYPSLPRCRALSALQWRVVLDEWILHRTNGSLDRSFAPLLHGVKSRGKEECWEEECWEGQSELDLDPVRAQRPH
jgi:hypothetical protein